MMHCSISFVLWHVVCVLLRRLPFTQSFSPVNGHGAFSMERKATFPPFSVAASFDGEAPLLYRADQIRRQAINLATRQEYSGGLGHLKDLFTIVEEANESTRAELIGIVEDAFGSFTSIAFTRPFRGRTARRRVCTGIEALTILLSSGYDVSQDRLLAALRALSAAISTEPDYARANGLVVQLTDMVFRLLQRLLTGVGVRNGSSKRQILTEKDFNSVLNAFASVGRMDAAHKVVALQERTPGAPQLSPVTYSILLKGYGRLGDTENVEMTLQKARLNNIIPDTVMLNSVMDALINCHEVTKAEDIFLETVMKNTTVTPNLRTYNTMLKGYALKGELGKAQQLANLMEAMSFWDSVTTNTLVTVAVMVEDFAYAEAILSNHTSLSDITEINKKRKSDHPNVEAYTALLDGYAKAGFLDKALGVLQTMQKIGVLANEYTYTCMIAALVKKNKFLQAMKLLEYMESRGTMPTSVTYNAFLSSLAHVGRLRQASEDNGNDSNNKTNPRVVERALSLLRRMVKSGVSPTVTTVSILLECFSTCSKPRVAEANAIVERFETDGTIPRNNIQVSTALIKVHGVAKDVKGALEIFRRIWRPDVIAVNAFLDAACRSGEVQVAFDTFGALFGGDSPSPRTLSPDVITYSILISSLVKINNVRAANKAQDLYKEMRSRKIFPDRPLVDMLLMSMIRGGRLCLKKKDIQFTLGVLKDAEGLEWAPGELEQRKQNVRAIMIGRISEVWKENEEYYGLDLEPENDLFRKKGWNKVDSGFRLWGGGNPLFRSEQKQSEAEISVDDFLASKGWNDVDSGFRII